jgi:hypothetical protein
MKTKLITLLMTLCLLPVALVAQSQLSPQQMQEDFDFLYEKIKAVNPHLAIRKQVTGCDVLAEIQNLRPHLDTICSEAGFFDLMVRALILCRDPHNDFSTFYPYSDLDTAVISAAIGETRRYRLEYFKYNTFYSTQPLFYTNGEYFLVTLEEPQHEFDEHTVFRIKVPGKSQLLAVNDLAIDEYNDKWNLPVHSEVRWDYDQYKYYAYSMFSPRVTMGKESFGITFADNGVVRKERIDTVGMAFANRQGKKESKVHYFANHNLLYIRLPEMDAEKIDFYRQEISKYKEYEIKKVVLDVRDNGGGNDTVWEAVLASVIKKPVEAHQKLCFRNNQTVREYLNKNNIFYTAETPLIIESDTLFCIEDVRNIAPDEQSLAYDGKIYVLINRNSFSSALALVAFCENRDNMITVGQSTGWLGGEGVMPFYFILPHSKLIFSLACSLDGNVKDPNPVSYYHDKIKIPVTLTVDDQYNEYYYSFHRGKFYDEDYLFNSDPVFQKVLEQKE